MEASEREAFREFVHGRSTALLKTAYLLTGDWHQAEDLLQTALAKTYLAWSRVRKDTADAYVRRVLVNTYASWWRRRWTGELPTDVLPDRAAPDPHAGSDDRLALHGAIRSLPRKQRAAIVLRYFDDLTEAETARVLGCSVGNVKSQTARALAKLRVDTRLGEPSAQEANHAGH